MRPAGPKVQAEAGRSSWGGAASPVPSAMGYGEHCKLPQRVWGGAPETKRFCSILTAMDGLWWYLNLVATGVLYVCEYLLQIFCCIFI